MVATFSFMIAGVCTWGTQASQLKSIETKIAAMPHNPTARPQPVAVSDSAPTYLDEFNGTAMLAKLYDAAQDIGFPLEEISYELEEAPTQPYMRYRVSLRAKTGYAEIRRFAAALLVDLSNISLDSLRCTREEITVVPLNCELAFSAFYKKGGNG